MGVEGILYQRGLESSNKKGIKTLEVNKNELIRFIKHLVFEYLQIEYVISTSYALK